MPNVSVAVPFKKDADVLREAYVRHVVAHNGTNDLCDHDSETGEYVFWAQFTSYTDAQEFASSITAHAARQHHVVRVGVYPVQ